MIKVLPVVLELALLIFCLIDAIQTPDVDIRNLPKWAWIVLILLFPLVGGIAWLVAGRPTRAITAGPSQGQRRQESERPTASTADIDERLEADLARLDREHEQQLRGWESELQARESRLRDSGEASPPT